MEETYQARAIVLKREPFRENDSRISVYSREKGKLELVARGTKKIGSKLAGHIEPFNLVDLMIIRGKQFDYVGTALNAHFFYDLKSDLNKILFAGKVLGEVNTILKPGIQDEIIFNALNDFLNFINSYSTKDIFKYEFLSNIFLLQIIIHLGYRPELNICVKCSKKVEAKGNSFSFRHGGIICKLCSEKKDREDLTISENVIKILRMAEKDYKTLVSLNINQSLSREVGKIINLYFQYNFK